MDSDSEIIRYKQQLASLIIGNERIVELINAEDIEEPEDLIHHNVFEFIRVPEVPEEQKTYICFKVNIPEVYTSNFMFKKVMITIYVITHQGLMITDEGGTRIDLIGREITRMLNGYKGIGKAPLERISDVEESLGDKHRCRIICFLASDLNGGCRKS